MAHSPLYRALARALTAARAANLRSTGAGPAVTRRQVLRGAAASGALAVAGCLPGRQLNDTPRIAIVGGGLAGLAAAWHLQNSRFAARVFEAASRVGGRTATGEINGLALNLGGEFIDSDHADLLGIAKELEVPLVDRRGETTDESVPAVAFYFDGRAIPESCIDCC